MLHAVRSLLTHIWSSLRKLVAWLRRCVSGSRVVKPAEERAKMTRVHITTAASILFIQSARRMSQLASELDDKQLFDAMDNAGRESAQAKLMDASLSTVLASYTHIEAIANELYLDTTLFGRPHWFPGIHPALAQLLVAAWAQGADELNPIDKFKRALSLAGRPQGIDWGRGHAQSLRFLHDLRNTLIHHQPITVEHGISPSRSDDELERSLHTRFKPAHIWEGRGVAFRWNGCLGGPCARWAYDTAAGFAADVFNALGTTYPSKRHW